MYALPDNTLLSKKIPKKAIFDKFSLNTTQRQTIDTDIARIDIIALLATETMPAIAKGKEVQQVYIMEVSLKNKNYHRDSIYLLSRLIPQKMVFILNYEEEAQIAIIHQGLHLSPWINKTEVKIPIQGLDFDAVWEYIVASLANIIITEGQTLSEQINHKKELQKIREKIAQLERKMEKERQLNKQIKLRDEIKKLQKELEIIEKNGTK